MSKPNSCEAYLRHAQYYENVLRSANSLFLQGGEAAEKSLVKLDLDWANIQLGQTRAATYAGDDNSATQLCYEYPLAGGSLLDLRQTPRESLRWLETALAAAQRLKIRLAEVDILNLLG